MNDTRKRHLFLVLTYFFLVILLAGMAMITISKTIREVQVFWVIKQILPSIILGSFLAVGIVAFDKMKLVSYISIVERVKGVKHIFPFVLLGCALFLVSVVISYVVNGGVPNNNVYSSLPLSRFIPYFLAAMVFTGIVQPVLEEIIFRGRILPVAKGVVGMLAATTLVSVLFSLLHYANLYSSFIFSWVMCVLAFRYGIRACFAAHISYNVISILVDAF
jgi:CAAX amino terminal protease family.